MAVNKVEFGGETLIDLTNDSVTEDTLLSGATAHDKSGRAISGNATIGDGTLTIKRNGQSVGSFSANQSGNKDIDITVPELFVVRPGETTFEQVATAVNDGRIVQLWTDEGLIYPLSVYSEGEACLFVLSEPTMSLAVFLYADNTWEATEIPHADATVLDEHLLDADSHFTSAERTKLAGIQAGAQKNSITGIKGNAESSYRTGNVNITPTNIGLGNVDNVKQYSASNPPPYPVTSVAGKTGAVTLAKSDVGLGNVDNVKQYSASNPPPYPVSSVAGKTGTVTLVKSDVGLGSVVNTGDSAMPVSGGTTKFTTGGAYTELNKKVDKVSGKGLSTNDFTTTLKNKLENMQEFTVTDADNLQTAMDNADAALSQVGNKVDKVDGMGLSTNDFTNALKTKLSNLPTITEDDVDWWNTAYDTAAAALPKSGGTLTGNLKFDNSATSQKNEPYMQWGTVGGNTPYMGFAHDQSDGTFLICSTEKDTTTNGVKNYKNGLAIGGGSGNLLWKGVKVATTADIPSVPSVGNGTLTIKRNGTQVGTFSANQSGAASVNISVPTMLTDLDESSDANYVSASEKATWNNKVDQSEFDSYVESQSPRAVIENKGFIIVDKAEAPTGFTISDGINTGGNLSLRVEEDILDSSKMKVGQLADATFNGNNVTFKPVFDSNGQSMPTINLVNTTTTKSGEHYIMFNFKQTGSVTTQRPNEVLVWVNGAVTNAFTCTSGTTIFVRCFTANAGDKIEASFYATVSTATAWNNYEATLSNICLVHEEPLQSVANNSKLPTTYARTVVRANSNTQNLRATYYESLNATLEKFRQAIIALGGTV